VSEGAELVFGTLDAQTTAQLGCEEKAPEQPLRNSRSGRDPRDQLRTAGIANTRRRNT